jgi:hypothetical protein
MSRSIGLLFISPPGFHNPPQSATSATLSLGLRCGCAGIDCRSASAVSRAHRKQTTGPPAVMPAAECDPISATPYHKNVAVRLAAADSASSAVAEAMSARIRSIAAPRQLCRANDAYLALDKKKHRAQDGDSPASISSPHALKPSLPTAFIDRSRNLPADRPPRLRKPRPGCAATACDTRASPHGTETGGAPGRSWEPKRRSCSRFHTRKAPTGPGSLSNALSELILKSLAFYVLSNLLFTGLP